MRLKIIIYFLIFLIASCSEERQIFNKVDDGKVYDFEVYVVKSSVGRTRVELRSDDGRLLIDPVMLNNNESGDYCEFFVYRPKDSEAVEVCVNSGQIEWIWIDKGVGNWILEKSK